MAKIILDLDDFGYKKESNCLDWLYEFHSIYDFKVTLFTVYGLCTNKFLDSVSKLSWIEMAVHGLNHKSNDEVLSWNEQEWNNNLQFFEDSKYFIKGFKAPNWQMSDIGYKVLKERGWWVAIRDFQIKDLPKGMMYYAFETNKNSVHGHIWLMDTHYKEGKFNWDTDDKFEFVSQNTEIYD